VAKLKFVAAIILRRGSHLLEKKPLAADDADNADQKSDLRHPRHLRPKSHVKLP
jgi:hypothetical protein